MADPFSVAVSALTLLVTCTTCADGLLSIIDSFRHAPEELMSLSNDVNNLKAVISEAHAVCNSNTTSVTPNPQFIGIFERHLMQAKETLEALEELVVKCKSKTVPLDQCVTWLFRKNKAKTLQKKLRDLKSNIHTLLITDVAFRTPQISIGIQELRSALAQVHQQMEYIPAAVAGILLDVSENQSRSLTARSRKDNRSQLKHDRGSLELTTVSDNGSEAIELSCSSILNDHDLLTEGNTQTPEPVAAPTPLTRPFHAFSKSVICFRMRKQSHCPESCDCHCHSTYRYRTPLMLRKLIGTLILGYTGLSVLGSECSNVACQNHRGRSLEITYCFPQWLLERAVHIVAATTNIGTPIFGLEVRRRVGWGGKDGILRFALTGNTTGVKSLLVEAKASMTDVDPNHGRTALYYAVLHNRIEVCEFLLRAGADPHVEDDYGISTYHKAWEQIFIRNGTTENLQALKRLFPQGPISETWEFTQLHKIVLCLLPVSLESTLQDQQYREQVDIKDYRKRTPLHWAATRGDASAVRVLLENGADVNLQDDSKGTPLILAASSGSMETLRMLLEAGANVSLTDIRGGHALHYVCRHQKDIAPVKLLLETGAPVNCQNIYGHTPFVGAAIKNRHEIGSYLLAHGADIHVGGNNNDTPLFESVFHNSHDFLRLLLQNGAKHTDVNKAGSTILHAAALEADLGTIEILASAGLAGLDIDSVDCNGKTALEICEQRVASPDGFQEAFVRLLKTLEMN